MCARVITKTHSQHKSLRNPIAITVFFLRRHVLRNPYVWNEISMYTQGDEEERWMAKKKITHSLLLDVGIGMDFFSNPLIIRVGTNALYSIIYKYYVIINEWRTQKKFT